MASSNFLQWNEPQNNQESDAAYAADTQRSGGAPVDAIFPSATANKLFYQLSTMVAAIAQFMVNEGFNAQDGNLATLVANLTTALQNLSRAINVVAFSATPNFNLNIGLLQAITLTGNVTASTISGLAKGQLIIFIIHQNSAGGWTFAWPASIPGGGIDPAALSTSIQMFIVDDNTTVQPVTTVIG